MSHRIRAILLAAITAAGAGCSSDGTSGGEFATARVMFIHAIADTTAVDVRGANGLPAAWTAVPFGRATGYEIVPAGALSFTVQPSPSTAVGSPRSIASLSGVTIRSGASVTLVATGDARDTVSARAAGMTAYLDDVSDPPAGQVRLRVINASPDAGAVDVYVTPASTLRSGTATLPGLDYRSAAKTTLPAGSYIITVLPLSEQSPVLNEVGLNMTAGAVHTLVLRGYRGALPPGLGNDRRLSLTSTLNVSR